MSVADGLVGGDVTDTPGSTARPRPPVADKSAVDADAQAIGITVGNQYVTGADHVDAVAFGYASRTRADGAEREPRGGARRLAGR
ncbi:hypothetical protein [Streptomyces rubradiris]|uniref:hypothetical protein n=1 Tax=Streptomyces rubradiris TaxID=285531 RepID=UPI0016756709|nr:hypothetical protein [Streptomyces rubradiris]